MKKVRNGMEIKIILYILIDDDPLRCSIRLGLQFEFELGH